MANLEQIVLPLEQSRALVEKGIVLDTAMVWFIRVNEAVTSDEYWWVGERSEICGTTIVPAPVLSELLDAIRAKHPDAEIISRCIWPGAAWVIHYGENGYLNSYGDSPLLAAAALLLEVAK